MSQPSTDNGFVGNLICPLAMAIWLPIDIQPTNAMLATPPTSAPCSYKNNIHTEHISNEKHFLPPKTVNCQAHDTS
jgi:hypothetical protein